MSYLPVRSREDRKKKKERSEYFEVGDSFQLMPYALQFTAPFVHCPAPLKNALLILEQIPTRVINERKGRELRSVPIEENLLIEMKRGIRFALQFLLFIEQNPLQPCYKSDQLRGKKVNIKELTFCWNARMGGSFVR